MLSPIATSFKRNGIAHLIIGVFSVLWQIGVYVCAALHSDEFNIYKQDYARDIANGSSGLIAGIVFIITGLAAHRSSSTIHDPSRGDATKMVKIFKGFSIFSIVIALVLVLFSGYLAYLTSHQYEESRLDQITIAHAALPFHVLHCIFGLLDIGFSVRGLLLNPITKPLPPVAFTARKAGIENPGYSTSVHVN